MTPAPRVAHWSTKIKNSSTMAYRLCRITGPTAFLSKGTMLKSDKISCSYSVANCIRLRTFWMPVVFSSFGREHRGRSDFSKVISLGCSTSVWNVTVNFWDVKVTRVQSRSQTQTRVQSRSQTQTRVQSRSQTQTRVQSRSQTQTRVQSRSQTQTRVQSRSQTQTRVQSLIVPSTSYYCCIVFWWQCQRTVGKLGWLWCWQHQCRVLHFRPATNHNITKDTISTAPVSTRLSSVCIHCQMICLLYYTHV